MKKYDVVVIGVGGIGSAVVYQLAARGLRVLGLDRHGVAHDRGSSHGESRMIRRAYFEHPDYVPLIDKSYAAWAQIESDLGETLFMRSGLFLAGPPEGEIVQGVLATATKHNLDIETLTDAESAARFPQFRVGEGLQVMYERDAGYLRLEVAIRRLIETAASLGAELKLKIDQVEWCREGGQFALTVDGSSIGAERLVLCAGPWTAALYPPLARYLTVRRKPFCWYMAAEGAFAAEQGCPAFGFDTTDGFMYGFPVGERGCLKIGNHTGGETTVDPDLLDRTLYDGDCKELDGFVSTHLASTTIRRVDHAVCMYTMSPDEHFLLGPTTLDPGVCIVAGLSGHGFKFAPAIGLEVADWIFEGAMSNHAAFLSPDRFLSK